MDVEHVGLKQAVPRRWFHKATILACALLLVPVSTAFAIPATEPKCNTLLGFASWFDPIFFTYNFLLVVFAVLVIPGITYFYVTTMRKEKLRRLRNDIGETRWAANAAAIGNFVKDQFSIKSYFGSMFTLSLVVLLGASIILMLKAVPHQGGTFGCGVDYSKGANMLILGTYIEQFGVNSEQYFHRVVISLTAFQFGFLGAYVYLISEIVRGFYTLDLSPRTFVGGSIRIITASLLALVISFITADRNGALDNALPAIAFILGYFPESALVFLKKSVYGILGMRQDAPKVIELSKLPGMSYLHETRLIREGYDNVENLSNARPFDLVLLTGYSYRQVRQWIAQAWLCMHLREQDYADFVLRTGITSADELLQFIEASTEASTEARKCLNEATLDKYSNKIAVLCELVKIWREKVDREFKANAE